MAYKKPHQSLVRQYEGDLPTLNMLKKCTRLHHWGSLVHQRVAELIKFFKRSFCEL